MRVPVLMSALSARSEATRWMIIAASRSSTASDEVSPVRPASAVSVGRMREPRSACSSTALPTISARSVRRYLPSPTGSTQPAATSVCSRW